MSRRQQRTAALAAAALIGAGCGSGSPTGKGGATEAQGSKLTDAAKAVKFAQCMRANGVADYPDPDDANADSYGVSVTPKVFSGAVRACKALKPPGALSMKLTPKQQTAALKFAVCVRAHGVKDFPDPVSGEPLVDTYKIPSTDQPGGMDILNAAMKTCGQVLKASAGGQGDTGG